MIARRLRLPLEAYLDESERGVPLHVLLADEWREFTARARVAPIASTSTNQPRTAHPTRAA